MKCCFIGHRDSVGLEEQIYAAIKRLIQQGVHRFYSGGMGNFDRMCERAVKSLGGTLIFVPYNVKQIKEKDRLWYDSILCPFGGKAYEKFDIPNRNKWMVEYCDVFVCHVYKSGGAKRTRDYAINKNKLIIDISRGQ